MRITIDSASAGSLQASLRKLEAYVTKLRKLETELPRVLTEFGAESAQVKFDSAVYDVLLNGAGTIANINVTSQPTGNGFAVVANGREVCFVEFGAGVHFNGAGSTYKGQRPTGIDGIGEFGKGHGKQHVWVYESQFSGNKMFTQGTPASNAMYYTANEIRRRVVKEARRILNSD